VCVCQCVCVCVCVLVCVCVCLCVSWCAYLVCVYIDVRTTTPRKKHTQEMSPSPRLYVAHIHISRIGGQLINISTEHSAPTHHISRNVKTSERETDACTLGTWSLNLARATSPKRSGTPAHRSHTLSTWTKGVRMCVSIRQHTSAWVSYVSIRQHASAMHKEDTRGPPEQREIRQAINVRGHNNTGICEHSHT
jgi:hypothetical protein